MAHHLPGTARHRLHAAACERVTARLRGRGHTVAVSAPGQDLVVDGCRHLNVRAARMTTHEQVVRWHGRVYRYRYPRLLFNVHRHGVPAPLVAWWVLADMTGGQCWIVPGAVVAGRYTIHVSVGRRRGRDTILDDYLERWEGLAA